MRAKKPSQEAEAIASVLAWASARGIPVRHSQGQIILEVDDANSDPLLKVMKALLNGRLQVVPPCKGHLPEIRFDRGETR